MSLKLMASLAVICACSSVQAQTDRRAPTQEGWAAVVSESPEPLAGDVGEIQSPPEAGLKAEVTEIEPGLEGDATTGYGRTVIQRR